MIENDINKISTRLRDINKYYNEECPMYIKDVDNNMCIKIPDWIWSPVGESPTMAICPYGGKLIDRSTNPITNINKYDFNTNPLPATAPRGPYCIKCINGAILQPNGTCRANTLIPPSPFNGPS